MLEGSGLLSSFITGTSNFCAQYNFQSIAIALLIMSTTVCTTDEDACEEGEQQGWVHGTASAVIFVGAVCGQLGMGFLGDYLNRNHALAATLSVAAFGALMSAAAPRGSARDIYATIIVFRFVLGVGLGGVYPLSATKSAEDASSSTNNKEAINSSGSAWAYFWQMPGLIVPWFLGYCFTFATRLTTENSWRLILGLGSLPAVAAIVGLIYEDYLINQAKLSKQRTDNFVEDINITSCSETSGIGRAENRVEQSRITCFDIIESLNDLKIRNNLIAAGGSWLLYDIVVYGVNLLGGFIVQAITGDDDNVSSVSAIRAVSSNIMIAQSTSIPAVLLSIYLLPIFGLRDLQIYTFIFMAFCLVLTAGCFQYLEEHDEKALFALYCMVCFSMQFGLGITSFSLPSALFPHKIRSTFNGIAAALGKVGAIIGAYSLLPIAEGASYAFVLGMCAVIAIAGALLTQQYIPKDNKSAATSSNGTANVGGSGSGDMVKSLLATAHLTDSQQPRHSNEGL